MIPVGGIEHRRLAQTVGVVVAMTSGAAARATGQPNGLSASKPLCGKLQHYLWNYPGSASSM